jgi:hypothetical protein
MGDKTTDTIRKIQNVSQRPVNTREPKIESTEYGFWYYLLLVILALLFLAVIFAIFGNSSARSINRNDNRTDSLLRYENLIGKTFISRSYGTASIPQASESNKMITVVTPTFTQLRPFRVVSNDENKLVGKNDAGTLTISRDGGNYMMRLNIDGKPTATFVYSTDNQQSIFNLQNLRRFWNRPE